MANFTLVNPTFLKKLTNYMTKLCYMCLGCTRLEDSKFEGVYKCQNWVDNTKAVKKSGGAYGKKENAKLGQNQK